MRIKKNIEERTEHVEYRISERKRENENEVKCV